MPSHTHSWVNNGVMKEDTIDFFLFNDCSTINDTLTIPDIGSDHRGYLTMKAKPARIKCKKTVKLKSKTNWDKVNKTVKKELDSLQTCLAKPLSFKIDHDYIAIKISDIIRTSVNVNTPTKIIQGITGPIPDYILRLIKDRRKLRREFMSSRDRTVKSAINKLNKNIKK